MMLPLSDTYEQLEVLSKESQRRLSKRLSYVLRHNPGAAADVELDTAGWVDIDVSY